jgi:hypothetical protein
MSAGCRVTWLLILAACTGAACTGDSVPATSDGGTETDATSTSGTSAASAATGTQPPPECESTKDCETEGTGPGGFCVAPFDTGEGMGPAVCVPECLGENDNQRWCIDDAACCDGLTCHEVDGYCQPPDFPATSTGTGTGTSTSTSG